MAKKQTQKPSAELPNTYRAVTPVGEAVRSFKAKKSLKPKDGANNPLVRFCAVMSRVLELHPSFDVNTVIQECKSLEMENDVLIHLFDQFTGHLISLNRLTRIEGVYDVPVFAQV